MKLVLFDIDGTILLTDGAGKRAIHRALTEVFGGTGPDDHRFDGKTDPQIVRELMRIEGHGDDHIDAHMSPLFDRYVEYLRDELREGAKGVRVMPGVHDLIDALDARSDVLLGLLTGNLAEGARAKLASAGIDPARFRVGAYGSDHETRGELPAVAQR
ncbi:MAG: HAD family hydrolase, partial [Solirubrobacteraceae bacterium]